MQRAPPRAGSKQPDERAWGGNTSFGMALEDLRARRAQWDAAAAAEGGAVQPEDAAQPPVPSRAAQQRVHQLVAAAAPEARAVAAAAFAAQVHAAKPIGKPIYLPASLAGQVAVSYGAPPRPREGSPPAHPQSQRQVKTQRVDDGMEQSLVVYEPPAPMQPAATMQHIADIPQTSLSLGNYKHA